MTVQQLLGELVYLRLGLHHEQKTIDVLVKLVAIIIDKRRVLDK